MRIDEIPVTVYQDVRPMMEDGDLVFFSAKTVTGFLIRLYSKFRGQVADFSHVGIVRWDRNRLMIIEAVSPLCRQVNLSNLIRVHKGDAVFAKVESKLSKELSEMTRKKVIDAAIDKLGIEYETISKLVGSFISEKFKSVEGDSKLYCSEYASLVWIFGGIYLLGKEKAHHPSPTDLFNSPYLRVVGRIKCN